MGTRVQGAALWGLLGQREWDPQTPGLAHSSAEVYCGGPGWSTLTLTVPLTLPGNSVPATWEPHPDSTLEATAQAQPSSDLSLHFLDPRAGCSIRLWTWGMCVRACGEAGEEVQDGLLGRTYMAQVDRAACWARAHCRVRCVGSGMGADPLPRGRGFDHPLSTVQTAVEGCPGPRPPRF